MILRSIILEIFLDEIIANESKVGSLDIEQRSSRGRGIRKIRINRNRFLTISIYINVVFVGVNPLISEFFKLLS